MELKRVEKGSMPLKRAEGGCTVKRNKGGCSRGSREGR